MRVVNVDTIYFLYEIKKYVLQFKTKKKVNGTISLNILIKIYKI